MDLLGQVAGIGDFAQVLVGSVKVEVEGRTYKVLGLAALIRSKEALDRPRDRRAIVQHEALLERARRGQGP